MPIESRSQVSIDIHVQGDEEPLTGSSVVINDSIVWIADENGRVLEWLETGKYFIRVSHVGFYSVEDSFTINSDSKTLKYRLVRDTRQMEEIIVIDRTGQDQVNSLSTGFQEFTPRDFDDMPLFLGERDPIKYVQVQTGVLTGTDGNNGFYVRGGSIDQNMISIDNMELYNTNHLFGFFSMFNSSAIGDIQFYKSGLPADLGKRLSSSTLVNTRRPDFNARKGDISMGLLAASLYGETPVIKGKSALMLGYRRSYLDLITQNLFNPRSTVRRTTDYSFQDIIGRYHHQVNDRNTISLSFMSGSDDYNYESNSTLSNKIFWKTGKVGITWKRIFDPTFDTELWANIGYYSQKFEADISVYNIDLRSTIGDVQHGGKFWKKIGDEWTWLTGYDQAFRKMLPNEVDLEVGSDQFTLNESQRIPSLETAVFSDISGILWKDLEVGLGIRMSHYMQLGPYTEYVSIENFQLLDTIRHPTGQKVVSYINPEPRLRVNYRIRQNFYVKTSYDRNYQYIHLAPVSSISLPTDLWVPSSRRIKPQRSDQFALGTGVILKKIDMILGLSGFAKLMDNQLEYRSGAIVGYSLGNNFDDVFIFGKGEARGIEISAKRFSGWFTGEMAYTLSRTDRNFDNINEGRTFPAKYDRRHDLNLTGTVSLSNWTLSVLFKYASGSALTLPVARYVIEGNVISEYQDRNTFRMPDYHRLDLSVKYAVPGNRSTWVFSVFNVYNNRNPFFIYLDVRGDITEDELRIKLEKVSLFPILPSLAYQIHF